MKRIKELLNSGKFIVTYEPNSPAGFIIEENIISETALRKIDGFGIYSNPRGRPKLDSFVYGWKLMKDYEKDVIVNLRIQDCTVPLLQSTLWGGHLLGIRNILIVTGDYCLGSPFLINVTEGITGVRKYLNNGHLIPPLEGKTKRYHNRYLEENLPPGERAKGKTDFFIGAALTIGRKGEKKMYQKKLEGGVQFFITQLAYDSKTIIKFLEEMCPPVPILVGTAPINSIKRVEFLKKLGVSGLTKEKIKMLKEAKDIRKKSVETAVEMYHELRDFAKSNGCMVGAHVMSIKSPEDTMKIIEKIER